MDSRLKPLSRPRSAPRFYPLWGRVGKSAILCQQSVRQWKSSSSLRSGAHNHEVATRRPGCPEDDFGRTSLTHHSEAWGHAHLRAAADRRLSSIGGILYRLGLPPSSWRPAPRSMPRILPPRSSSASMTDNKTRTMWTCSATSRRPWVRLKRAVSYDLTVPHSKDGIV